MEMIMSLISNTIERRNVGVAGTALRGFVGTLRRLWMAYMEWRLQRLAIAHLHTMSDRELKDIGVTRFEIEFAVKRHDNRHRVFDRTC
jgi:uncharacterized protein YjiS (DUF1127 family)